MSSLPSACCDLVGAHERVVDPPHDRGNRIGRIQRLVGIHLAGDVGVGRDLPARQVNRLQAGLHLLHRLVAGQRAERVDERLLADQLPELFGAAPRERVLDVQRAAQPHDVLGRVAALDAFPARVFRPVLLEPCRFEIVIHRCPHRDECQRSRALRLVGPRSRECDKGISHTVAQAIRCFK